MFTQTAMKGVLFFFNAFSDSKIAVRHVESALNVCTASRSHCCLPVKKPLKFGASWLSKAEMKRKQPINLLGLEAASAWGEGSN